MFEMWLDLLTTDVQMVGSRNFILKYFPPLESLEICLFKEHILLRNKTLSNILLQFVRGYAIIWHNDTVILR